MTTGAGNSNYLHDATGSVSDLTDAAAIAQAHYGYEPFGATTETPLTTGAPANPMRFTGEYQDPNGLYHLRARQYDPATGRFGAVDPIAPGVGDPAASGQSFSRGSARAACQHRLSGTVLSALRRVDGSRRAASGFTAPSARHCR